jgi:hypothetical protein
MCPHYQTYERFLHINKIFLFFQRLSEIETVPDLQILNSHPSKRVDEDIEFHHLLDNAMLNPRRRVCL